MKTRKVHFISTKHQKVACGAYYPPIAAAKAKNTENHLEVDCERCLTVIEKAAKEGRMIFE